MAKFIRQLCGELQLAICFWDMEPFEGDLSTLRYLTSLRNRPQLKQQDNFHQYLAELLVDVYSYCFMLKSVS